MGMCIPLIESVIWANLNESVFTPYCDRVWQRAISSSPECGGAEETPTSQKPLIQLYLYYVEKL